MSAPRPDLPPAPPSSRGTPGSALPADWAVLGGLFLVAAFVHNLFHELGHWTVGTVLGNAMTMTLNLAWPTRGTYLQDWHAPVVLLGGPAFSIIMAAAARVVLGWRRSRALYPFLFFPLFSRLFSLLFGGFDRQDEAGIAAQWALGRYTVALAICTILGVLAWWGARRLALRPREAGWWAVGAVVAQLAVIATDRCLA